MLRIFCCRSRRASNVEEDRITDSLESCLSHDLGVNEFQNFLVAKRLEKEPLNVFLKCNHILREISKLSPGFQDQGGKLPANIETAISDLYENAQKLNLDAAQVDALENLHLPDIDVKIGAIKEVQDAAKDLLQKPYKLFKKDFLNRRL